MKPWVGLLAAALIVAGCGDESASRSPVPPAPTHIDRPALPAGWTEVTLAQDQATRLAGVIADDDGFVIHGNVGGTPTVWTSPNGVDWASEALAGFDVSATAAATSGGATVLLGEGTTEQCAHPSRGFLWLRLRGEAAWASVPFHEIFCAGGFPHLAATSDGFVVAGSGAGDQPFAWASRDGWNWRDGSAGLKFESPPWRVTANGDGYLIVGRGERTDTLISADGSAWRAVATPPVPPPFGRNGVEIAVLLETRQGIFALFTNEEGVPRSAWRRELDGSWTPLDLRGFQGNDFVAGGFELDGIPYLSVDRGDQGRLLASADLATWVEVPVPQVRSIFGLAARAGRTVLLADVFQPVPDDERGRFVVYVSDAAPTATAEP